MNTDDWVFIESVDTKAKQVCVNVLSEAAFNCSIYSQLNSSELPGVMKRDGRSKLGV